MTVTNGIVEYARTTRPADFESKNAKVTLSFVVEEGSDPAPVVAKVMDMAVGEVHRRLGIEGVPLWKAVGLPADPGGEVVVDVTAVNAPKGRRAKAPPAEVPVADPTIVAPGEPASVGATAATTTAPTATPTTDPAAIGEPETVEPQPEAEIVYTDADLQKAIHLAIERKVGHDAIKGLIWHADFTGLPGKRVSDIPAEKRADFIARLKAMYDE